MHSEMPLLPHHGSALVPPEDILPMSLKLSTAFPQQPAQLPEAPDTVQ